MYRAVIGFLTAMVAVSSFGADPANVVVIPIRSEIASPSLFILRRGLKEAERQKAEVVVLDVNTPGGAVDITFEMMAAIGKFSGKTIAFVNTEAISAGAFISAATDEIWFAPAGLLGAAAPVQATGADIDATMKQKLVSYLKARVRATSESKGYRSQVVSAMIDSDYELKIGDEVLKPKGELLTLTATEASKAYGTPPQPLLAAGIAKSVDDLLKQKFPEQSFAIRELKITWSEDLAVFLTKIAPILLGLGMLSLFVEFKTPGFGLFGVVGIVLLGLVFLSSYVAGFSGHEPLLLFGLGVVLVMLELVFWHSAGVLGALGVAGMLASLLWTMADIWPNEPISVAWSADAFVTPLINLGLGVALAVVAFILVARFLPHGWVWERLAVQGAVVGSAQVSGGNPTSGAEVDALIGRRGIAATALRPGGQVEIDGRRYEARVEIGEIPPGTAIFVRQKTDFGLVVDREPSRKS